MLTVFQRRSRRGFIRRGFSHVELIVVLLVIALLFGLFLPTAQSAREEARRRQCSNNIKQFGLSLLMYHTSFGRFPPSSVWRSPKDWTKLDAGEAAIGNNPKLAENWMIIILPQLSSDSRLYKGFDPAKPIPSDASSTGLNGETFNSKFARGTQIGMMLCPSDSYNREPFNGTAGKLTDKLADGWARGNYGANAGLGYMTTLKDFPAAAADPLKWRNPLLCGVMGANTSLRMEEIKDGTSNTILLGELRAGVAPQDPRGVWAMGAAPGSALWGHGYAGDDNGPNCSFRGDGVCSCTDIQAAVGGAARLARLGMACDDANRPNWQQTAGSMHPGGVTVGMCDGSVRFISDFIQLGNDGNPPTLGVWDKLNLSNDGQAIDKSAY